MTSLPNTPAARARFARLVVACGILALLLGDVWQLPHLLFTRHVVCREHGELVHEHEEAAPRAPGEGRTETARISGAEAVSHGHEHCSSVATSARGVAIVLPPPARVTLLNVEPERRLASVERDSTRPLTVLVYAPKQGPPV